ncbi:MAG: DNA internalization-related competence protein ComEC/Rec2 [Bacillota bacterium]
MPLLLYCAACFSVGIAVALGRYALGVCLLVPAFRGRRVFILSAVFFSLGVLRLTCFAPTSDVPPVSDHVIGRVNTLSMISDGRLDVTLQILYPVTGRALLSIEDQEFSALPGDVIRLEGWLQKPPAASNPGQFCYRAYLQGRGIQYLVQTGRHMVYRVIEQGSPFALSRLSYYLRQRLASSASAHLDPQSRGLVLSVLLGERRALPGPLQEDMAKTALSHVLAVSGAHVGLLAAGVQMALSRLSVPDRVSRLVLSAILALYLAMTGAPPSAVRAVLMLYCVIHLRMPALQSLSAAALLMLSYNPLLLTDAGFQLSYAAVLGILFTNETWECRLSFLPSFIRTAAALSCSAGSFTLPLVLYHFGRWPLLGFVFSWLLLPLFAPLLYLMFLFGALSVLIPPGAALLGPLVNFSCNIFFAITSLGAALPGYVHLPRPSTISILAYYAVCFTVNRRPGPKTTVCSIVLCALIYYFSVAPRPDGTLEITFLDVGQGDAIYIKTPNGRSIIVDCGTEQAADSVVLPFLRAAGIFIIDDLFITHDHADHRGGLERIASEVRVRRYWASAHFMPHDSRFSRVGPGDSLDAGGVRIECLHPGDSAFELENDNSLVLLVSAFGLRVLLTGDLEQAGWRAMMTLYPRLYADVLKVAHHGGETSTDAEILAILQPSIAVISVGYNNFGHPSPGVLALLDGAGVVTYRTDQQGAITLRATKDGYRIDVFGGRQSGRIMPDPGPFLRRSISWSCLRGRGASPASSRSQ